MTLWRRVGVVLLWAVVALVVLRLVATATVAAAARAITVAHCVCRAGASELSAVEWGGAIVCSVARKALEGEVRVSGSCLFSSRAVNSKRRWRNHKKSRQSRVSNPNKEVATCVSPSWQSVSVHKSGYNSSIGRIFTRCSQAIAPHPTGTSMRDLKFLKHNQYLL